MTTNTNTNTKTSTNTSKRDGSCARIPLFDSEGLTPQQRSIYDAVVAGPRGAMVGPLRAALHSPDLAERWERLGEQLRYRTSLSPDQSELAIIVVARFWNSRTEWFIHSEIALAAGVSPAIIDAIGHARPPIFDDLTAMLIYEYTRQLLGSGEVADSVYHDLYARFGEVWMVELTALVGYYSMVALTLNAHLIPAPSGRGLDLPSLPPSSAGLRLPEASLTVPRRGQAAD